MRGPRSALSYFGPELHPAINSSMSSTKLHVSPGPVQMLDTVMYSGESKSTTTAEAFLDKIESSLL